MKSYTVKNRTEAWKKAAEIFPTDWEEDTFSSNRAGYPVYRSNIDSMFHPDMAKLFQSTELFCSDFEVFLNETAEV